MKQQDSFSYSILFRMKIKKISKLCNKGNLEMNWFSTSYPMKSCIMLDFGTKISATKVDIFRLTLLYKL